MFVTFLRTKNVNNVSVCEFRNIYMIRIYNQLLLNNLQVISQKYGRNL